uniref:C-type lectin domain-containing protein n=1 Tax=Calidris pygmaea TaxID=425635 RepID=A0A8C3K3E4_9CHAR
MIGNVSRNVGDGDATLKKVYSELCSSKPQGDGLLPQCISAPSGFTKTYSPNSPIFCSPVGNQAKLRTFPCSWGANGAKPLVLLGMCRGQSGFLVDEGCILCPMNWMSHGTKCYWVSHELSRWNSSREDCVNQGGQLMMPEDQKELDFINRNLQKPTRYFWIGLFFEKGWTWVNSSHLDPSRFQLNPQAEGRSCGVIREGRISTINCSAALQWICQKEATQL